MLNKEHCIQDVTTPHDNYGKSYSMLIKSLNISNTNASDDYLFVGLTLLQHMGLKNQRNNYIRMFLKRSANASCEMITNMNLNQRSLLLV